MIAPWRTLTHAATVVPTSGGFEIVVHAGTYDGPVVIERGFENAVVIRSQPAYAAVLTNQVDGNPVLYVSHQGPVRLALESFVVSNDGSARGDCQVAAGHLVQLTNVSEITFRDNMFLGNNRMPRCNDGIKVNLDDARFFPTGIRFLGNLFFSPPSVAGRDMIDVFEPGELDISDNIFASDRGGAGGGAFIHLWGEWGSDTARTPRYRITRNLFLNYEGSAESGFVELGGEGASIPEISDALIENNVFVGSSSHPMAAPLLLRGVRRVTVRANTVVGDLPTSAFGTLLKTDGANPAVTEVALTGNLWSDPTGTMGDTFLAVDGHVNLSTIGLDGNMFWNAGAPLPTTGALTPDHDASAVVADPRLPGSAGGGELPRWDPSQGCFQSGSCTIREEFERLVAAHAQIPANSPARDAAPAGAMPENDVLGRIRDDSPDAGAYESR